MKQEYHKTLKGQLHGVSDAHKEIVSDVLQGSATDFSGASLESDEPRTKKTRERAPKEKLLSSILEIVASYLIFPNKHL